MELIRSRREGKKIILVWGWYQQLSYLSSFGHMDLQKSRWYNIE